ncbi:hypothetical protein KKD52_17040 [Myxococcota bacterium]|nr:hypothetical protein [Myxococcota bacterium]MBU1411638.1 hypothetical protein [Myxococcota bacterium]MBU1512062.1 hypothetical protein [Myxococcota bacterium]
MPRPSVSIPLSLLALIISMMLVRFMPSPWWQRMLGPLFFCAGLFAWIGLGSAASRCRRDALRPWILLLGAWLLFAVLRWRFPPILPPPQEPFLEKLPVQHLDWHSLLFAWLPLSAFLQALSDFSRRFTREIFVRDRPRYGLIALLGLCAALPGAARPLPPLDFWFLLPIFLVIVIAFSLPALAHSSDRM